MGRAMNMERAFNVVERRALALRKTLWEVAQGAGVSRTKLWKAQKGKHVRPETSMKVLRDIEAHLDTLEAARK